MIDLGAARQLVSVPLKTGNQEMRLVNGKFCLHQTNMFLQLVATSCQIFQTALPSHLSTFQLRQGFLFLRGPCLVLSSCRHCLCAYLKVSGPMKLKRWLRV